LGTSVRFWKVGGNYLFSSLRSPPLSAGAEHEERVMTGIGRIARSFVVGGMVTLAAVALAGPAAAADRTAGPWAAAVDQLGSSFSWMHTWFSIAANRPQTKEGAAPIAGGKEGAAPISGGTPIEVTPSASGEVAEETRSRSR
jgi:hypothetical protein